MRTSASNRSSRVGIVSDAPAQELERDRLAELDVVGPVHLAHAAAAQRRDDPITAGEQRPGREDCSSGGGGWPELGLAAVAWLRIHPESGGGARLAGPIAWRLFAGHTCF